MRPLLAFIRRHRTSLFLACALAALAAAVWYFLVPTSLTVAVVDDDARESKVLAAYAAAFDQSQRHVRLRLVGFPGYRETAQALERDAADLALVRPDIVHPRNGLTTVILREEAVVLVAPEGAKIETLADLEGRRLGVLARNDADLHLLDIILDHVGLGDGAIQLVRVAPAELDSGQLPQVDALAFVATPQGEEARRIVASAMKALGNDLTAVPLEGLQALTALRPGIQETTIAAGALSPKPKFPKEELKTAGISYRLVAADRLDRVTVSLLTQYLIEMRPRVAADHRAANLMKQPPGEQEMSAPLPNHRGAIDYFNREQQTFMDRWGDWLWLGLFAAGGITTVLAWLQQVFVRQRQEVVDRVLDRLLCMIPEARSADLAGLGALSEEIDDLVTYAVRHARWRITSARTMSALVIALDGVRAAIADRRRALDRAEPDLVPEQSALDQELGTAAVESS